MKPIFDLPAKIGDIPYHHDTATSGPTCYEQGVADAFWDGLGLHPWDREEFWKEETYR